MKNIISIFINVLKYLLFFLAVAMTLYITLFMYKRVEKNIIESYSIFIPYALLLGVFIINIIMSQKKISENIFYNVTCSLVFTTTIFICFRAIFDKSMVLNSIMGYGINFNYFMDYIPFMKIMIYGLILSNFLLMSNCNNGKIARKIK